MNNSKVIAISGVSGAGKTTIVKQLANAFDCPYLRFDDFVDKSTYPNDMKSWLQNGADVSLIKTPTLVTSLNKMKSQNSSRFIFVEEPFGRERKSIMSLIDCVILLDQPMELCLARIINRNIENANEDTISSISNYLQKYQDHLREIYIAVTNQVRINADLIFQDTVSIQKTTDYICNWLLNEEN